jgi:hypothetical protein
MPEVEQIGTGFTFTEGPIWNPEGGLPALQRHARATRGAAGTSRAASPRWPKPSNKGNGMTLDAQGA